MTLILLASPNDHVSTSVSSLVSEAKVVLLAAVITCAAIAVGEEDTWLQTASGAASVVAAQDCQLAVLLLAPSTSLGV